MSCDHSPVRQKVSSKLKTILDFCLFGIISAAIILLCVEGAGRLVIHLKYGHPGKSYGLWQSDPELGATHRPHGYNTLTSLNNYGFRNREDVFEPKPKNALRVIAFGGSTTFGYNLRDGETFTEKLESKLRALPGYEKTQVLNAGEINYSAGQNLIMVKRFVPELKPDFVILYEGFNEIVNAMLLVGEGTSLDSLKGRYGVISQGLDQHRWLKQRSIIVRFFDYVVKLFLDKMRGQRAKTSRDILELKQEIKPVYLTHPWVLENYEHVLGEMIDVIRASGSVPIVIRYAVARGKGFYSFSDINVKVAKEKGVPVCDMRTRFEEFGEEGMMNLFIHTWFHVNPKGAEVLADELYQTLLKELPRKT